MHKGLFGLFSIILLVSSCSGESLNISVVCEENSVGNCIIKWETTPLIEGKVKIYASTHPEKIPEAVPVSIANISDQRIVIVPADPTKRYYYKMVFNNRHRVVTATRNINIPGIQNVRDLGGYSANKGKTVRYGKVFRSGEFDHLSSSAYTELKNIGIKTIVDLRDPKEVSTVNSGLKTKEFNVIQIPIGIINAHEIIRELVKGEVRNDSIHRLVLRMNRELVTYYRAEYKQLFDVLLEKKNYPVMIHCTSGKGRTAIASSLLFAALGVSYDSAMHDYKLSNDYFDIPRFSKFAYDLPAYSQEAITTLFSARESFLNAARAEIVKNYGNVETYMERGLGLSADDLNTLKDILLK